MLVRRDGAVLEQSGGSALPELRSQAAAVGRKLAQCYQPAVADSLQQLTRRAIALRGATEAEFEINGIRYEIRATAQGPDRAICTLRRSLRQPREQDAEADTLGARFDRRGFLSRYKESMALAALADRPTAVAVIKIDGLADIAQAIDNRVAEQVITAAIRRLPRQLDDIAQALPWYMGQLSTTVLVVVLETSDRQAVEACVRGLLLSLRQAVEVGDASFYLRPYAGVAILGRDATAPKTLLEHARVAAEEVRRSENSQIGFFSDTMRMKALTRLDVARELREAIGQGQISLRYFERHDLVSGDLTALVGYLRWDHPLRGEVRPAEFLRVAETTGLAEALSKTALQCLQRDHALLAPTLAPDVRWSFGGLRHHLMQSAFHDEILRLLDRGTLPASQLELRISERAYLAHDPRNFDALAERGVTLVVDEVARGAGSLGRLARGPLWGLQLDRSWTAAPAGDPVAQKVCRAAIAMARGLGLTPLATGVDDAAQRERLLKLGCTQGTGDHYGQRDLSAASRSGRE